MKELITKEVDSLTSLLTKEYNVDLTKIETVNVTDKQSLLIAESNIKELKEISKKFKLSIEPLKKQADEIHKKIVSVEKAQIQKIDSLIAEQESPIKKYKQIELEKQLELKRIAQEEARKRELELKRIQDEELERLRKIKQAELDELEKRKIPIAQKIDEIEQAREEIKQIESVVVPTIEISAQKVVLKKDEIKTRKVYSCNNKNELIKWALINDQSLLKIDVIVSRFNELCKNPEFTKLPFIDCKEEIV